MTIPTLKINPVTAGVVRNLAKLKIEQDYLIKRQAGKVFVEQWINKRITCSLHPSSYARKIIPFLGWNDRESERACPCFVPTEIAIGACIKGYPESIKEKDVPERIEKYRTNPHVAGAPASGDYIPQLGLYIAHEGKHRVAFMRHHNEPFFLADVSELNYPPAHRIKIVDSSLPYARLSYAVLDDRYLQLLSPAPYSSVELLASYGVEKVSWSELNAPSERFLFDAILESGLLYNMPANTSEEARTFDFQKLIKAEFLHRQNLMAKEKKPIIKWLNILFNRNNEY